MQLTVSVLFDFTLFYLIIVINVYFIWSHDFYGFSFSEW